MRDPANRHPGLTGSGADLAGAALVSRAVRAAKRGDRSALQFLYVRFADDLQRQLQTVVLDRADAGQLTQRVFAALPAAIGSYDERSAPFAGWLYRQARNAALDQLREHSHSDHSQPRPDRVSFSRSTRTGL